MIEIIPNWHPVLVHFTIGLLLTAAGLFLAGAMAPGAAPAAQATVVARWNLRIGTGFALLTVAAARAGRAGHTVETLCGDFHRLPLPETRVDTAVAAFCLYHSAHPEHVVAEISRCLALAGRAILVTKSADSYHEIDHVIAASGLDPEATSRPSLYTTFHGDVAATITETALRVDQVVRQRHVFRFAGLEHLAAYVATSPKYRLPEHLAGNAAELANELRRRIPDEPVTATSTISYIMAVKP